jgi:periplasmic protein TonB
VADSLTRYLVMSVVLHGMITGGVAGFSMQKPKFKMPDHTRVRIVQLPGSKAATSTVAMPSAPIPAAPTPAPPPKDKPKPQEQVKTQKKKLETKPAPPSKKKPERPKPEPETKGQVREDPRTGGFKGKVESPAAPPSLLPGGGAASIGVDAADFTYSYYLVTIQTSVAREWSAPAGAGARLAVIYFTIERDGRIVRPMVETKSGDDLFDRTALRAVERAHLPPLPDEFADRNLGIHFQFEYTP